MAGLLHFLYLNQSINPFTFTSPKANSKTNHQFFDRVIYKFQASFYFANWSALSQLKSYYRLNISENMRPIKINLIGSKALIL